MFKKTLISTLITGSLALSFNASAAINYGYHGTSLTKALTNSDVSLSFRGRYETVDQANMDNKADALTMKSRISVATGRYYDWSLGLEVDNVYTFIDDYNDGQNGYVDYPVVLDPEGTDINLGYIKYSTSDMRFVLGRQRIEHENQRFIGGSGWRQNEQTYDGFRAQFKNSSFELDYSFINNINSVTDDDIKGDFHLANLSFDLNKSSKLSVYAYLLDFENNISASTSTYGVHYQGKFGQVMFNARAASQSDYADNVTDYSAKYLNAEIGYHFKKSELVILGGYEVLGSDEGNSFQTPLATNHNFQGWSDQFLVTPNEGVQDIYITIKGKIGKATLEATYHDFVEDLNDKDLGSEVNGLISYEINKNYRFLIKYAAYNAGSVTFNKVDTKKTWVEFHAYF